MITAIVPTGPSAHSEEFIIQRFAGDNWRMLSDVSAIDLKPVCDSSARPVSACPIFDRLEVWPVRWGYPGSLIIDNPEDVEKMKRAHFAGKHEVTDGNFTWEFWLERFGLPLLWQKHSTSELEKTWLNNANGPGFRLHLLAGTRTHVSKADMNSIRFRADFHHGQACSTVYLSDCAKRPLHVDEVRSLPSFIARQERLATPEEPIAKRRRARKRETLVSKEFVCQQWGGIGWARVRQICRENGLDHERLTESEVGKVARARSRGRLRNNRNLRIRTQRRKENRRGGYSD